MPIVPLPQFEADLEEDRKIYEALKPPTTVVARFGVMRMVGEFPFDLNVKPGCGSKLVLRTHRGTEIGEMLTSTCPNSGCSKSVSRKEMLEYIENSGGKDYPFYSNQTVGGPSIKVLRIATVEDLNAQAKLDETRRPMVLKSREFVEELGLPIKMVEAEPLLGQERLTFYFNSEERIDFRDLVRKLSEIYHTRIELRQIGARDEARLTADYERCGQHCCCRQFLKVLKPISMKAAKVQKATLDPLKISGRCGRLMCCLRYEDQTYTELAKKLPRKKSRVLTPDGPGTVLDGQILTQLVLVQLDNEDRQVAVPVEELEILPPGSAPAPRPQQQGPGGPAQSRAGSAGGGGPREDRPRRPREGGRPPQPDSRPPRAPDATDIPDITEIGGDGPSMDAASGVLPDARQSRERPPESQRQQQQQGQRPPRPDGRSPQGRERRDRPPQPQGGPRDQQQRQGPRPDGRGGDGRNRVDGRGGGPREGQPRDGRPRDGRPRDDRPRGGERPGRPDRGPDQRGLDQRGPRPDRPQRGPEGGPSAGPPPDVPPPPPPPAPPADAPPGA